MDLSLVSDADLANELRKRGVACVIAMVKHDETTGTKEALFGVFGNGPLSTRLGLTAFARERTIAEAMLARMPNDQILDVLTEARRMVHRDALPGF